MDSRQALEDWIRPRIPQVDSPYLRAVFTGRLESAPLNAGGDAIVAKLKDLLRQRLDIDADDRYFSEFVR